MTTPVLQGRHFINGQWITGLGATFFSKNPADNTVLWQGHLGTETDIQAAFEAASHALPSWAMLDFATRAHHIQSFAKTIEANRQALTELIAKETGKPLWEAATEVQAVIGKAALSIQAYQERTSNKHVPQPEADGYLRYKPHGVIAILGPFNFPAHLSNGHIIPALLAGNTIIYKPSELTPAVAEFVLRCWHDSGLPPGVINGIQGDASSAKHLLNQAIQGVYFTGSYQTGAQISQQLSTRPEVLLALEMGGNNPLILDKDISNLNAAIYHTLLSAFITAGQRCTCTRRLMIPADHMGDTFLEQLIKACQTLRIGPYTNQPEPFMGPVIGHAQALHHLATQQKLKTMGGNTLLPMSLLSKETGFLSPGIMDMSTVKNPPDEEIFAPFLQVYRYNAFEEALDLANQTRYGLAAGLLSQNPVHYQQFYNTIQAGLINWNKPTTGAASNLPFGGVGRSGNHRPSAYFAADYCAYPVASLEQATLTLPKSPLPGITL